LYSPAREEFNACRLRAFPVAVDWLLATFAPVELLAGEYKRISNFTQGLHETPRDFSLRIRTAASRLGSLMDTASVSILLEGLHPSLSGFVRSALRDQRPTFANIIQEAELIHRSITATTPVQNPRTSPGSYSRTRPEILRPYREARPTPVLALEAGPYFGDSVTGEVPGQFCQHPVEPLCHSARVDPGSFDSVETAFDEILLATLALPQQVRYCYTCWRPGHFSAECPLIPKGEREAIAKRRAEIMRSSPSRFPSKYGPRSPTPATNNLVASTVNSVETLASTENYQLPEEPVRLRENL
jgi:Zinc knuckle